MTSAEEHVQSGLELLEEEAFDEAAEAFVLALEEDHDQLEACLGLARVSLATSMFGRAAEVLEYTLERAPQSVQALILRGVCQEAQDKVQEAIASYGQAVKADPKSYAARFQLGRALYAARRYKEAIRELVGASRLSPASPEPQHALGMAYRRSRMYGEAVAAFAKVLELDPTYLDGYVTLADVLCEARRLEAAEKVLLQAQSLFPDAGAVYDKLAAVRLKRGRLAEVVQTLQEQVRIEPANEQAHVNLYTFALLAGDVPAAAAAVERLIELHPQSWRGHHLRSMLYDLADRPELAEAELRKARFLAPDRWEPPNDLGTLLNARAQTERAAAVEAVEVLEAACALAPPSEPAPRYNLALAYWNARREADARRTAEDLVSTGPAGHAVLRDARELLAALCGTVPQAPRQGPAPAPMKPGFALQARPPRGTSPPAAATGARTAWPAHAAARSLSKGENAPCNPS